MVSNKDAIKLTNKTALALRRSAKRIEKISLITALVITLVLCVLTVMLGVDNLWVVPVMIPVIIALDVVIISFSRSYYLMLLSQAICTEASARDMREREQDKRRRERAISDLEDMREDMREGGNMRRLAQAGLLSLRDEDEDEEEDDDLAAPVRKPVKKAAAPVRPVPPVAPVAPVKPSAPVKTTIVPPASMCTPTGGMRVNPYEEEEKDLQEDDAPRRRRRKPTLQVIHGDQAR